MGITKNIVQALSACLMLSCTAGVPAQQEAVKTATVSVKPARMAYFIDASVLDMGDLLPPPAAVGSPANDVELAELHRIEQTRTPEQVAQAKADDAEEDMFIFKTVFGPNFNPAALPLTAALGEHVKNEQGIVGAQLKSFFQRPRPYQTDATLHPVCELTQAHNAYPSGHSLTGYLEAFTLAEMVPEKRLEILARADEYAYNRMVCGVHYRSDIEASRRASYAVFGYMLATPRFQRDLAAAREEMRAKLSPSGKN